MSKRITKSTANALVRKHCAGASYTIQVDSRHIDIWCEDWDQRDEAEKAADAICEALGCSWTATSLHIMIDYKSTSNYKGDPNDRTSAWNY